MSAERLGDNYRRPRLKPWENAYLLRQDPADRIETCKSCGEDFDPLAGKPHRCEVSA